GDGNRERCRCDGRGDEGSGLAVWPALPESVHRDRGFDGLSPREGLLGDERELAVLGLVVALQLLRERVRAVELVLDLRPVPGGGGYLPPPVVQPAAILG